MEDTNKTQYALQIALETLRERCQGFQQRVILLEQENSNLKNKIDVQQSITDGSLTEIDKLKQRISQLTEQNSQLANNYHMVSTENRGLWSRLSNVTQVNANLGSKLNQINESLSQHNSSVAPQNVHTPLIRSKTFTQDEPRTKFSKMTLADDNERISLELEDISLRLISTIAQEKLELEAQRSQLNEPNTMFINSFAFAYSDDTIESTVFDELKEKIQKFKDVKEGLLKQNLNLQENQDVLISIKGQTNATCMKNNRVKTNTVSIQAVIDEVEHTSEHSKQIDKSIDFQNNESEKVCPMCNKGFPSSVKFNDFQNHVESHFLTEPENAYNG